MLANADMEAELARLSTPVLVIGGSLDRVRPAAMAEGYRQEHPRLPLRRTPHRHHMSVQTPDLISDAIDWFLKSVDA